MSADSGYRGRVEDVMRGGGAGLALRALLSVLSFLYGIAVRARLLLFGIKVLRVKRLSCPVISIGNITVGGTGKTPIAMYIAKLALEKGRKAVIISRGYKRSSRGLKVVSDYNALLCDAGEAGDEPYLMASSLKGVPVIVCADRVKAGQAAVERFSPDLIILDDGFQHIRCHRDLNVALIDGAIGLGNGRLLPRGILREPAAGLKRADIIMIKGAGEAYLKAGEQALLRDAGRPVYSFEYRAESVTALSDGKKLPVDFIKGRRVVVISGIANNMAFVSTVEELGASVVMVMSRMDHHSYDSSDVKEISLALKSVDIVITTEKDAVKLKDLDAIKGLPVYSLCIEASVKDSGAFVKALSQKTGGLF